MLDCVIGGDYKGCSVGFTIKGKVYINYKKRFQKAEKIFMDQTTVEAYQIIDKNEKTKFGSGMMRSAIGGAMFGVAGAIAGANSAKKKTSYMVEVQFKDGKHSVLELSANVFRFLIGNL